MISQAVGSYVPVHDAAMSRNYVPEIFDLEGSLEAGGEESAERSDDGSEEWHEESVEEEGVECHRFLPEGIALL